MQEGLDCTKDYNDLIVSITALTIYLVLIAGVGVNYFVNPKDIPLFAQGLLLLVLIGMNIASIDLRDKTNTERKMRVKRGTAVLNAMVALLIALVYYFYILNPIVEPMTLVYFAIILFYAILTIVVAKNKF